MLIKDSTLLRIITSGYYYWGKRGGGKRGVRNPGTKEGALGLKCGKGS